MKFGYIAVFVTVAYAVEIHQVEGSCYPSTMQQDYNTCMSGFNRAFDLRTGSFSADSIKQYCVTSSADEIKCAQDLVNDCKKLSANVREALDKTVDINAIKNAIGIICSDNSTTALGAAKDCLSQYAPGVTSCLQEKYTSDMSAIMEASDTEAKYRAVCDLSGDVYRCQAPFGENCGRDVQTVFDAMAHASMPPVCSAVSASVSFALIGGALAFLAFTKKF